MTKEVPNVVFMISFSAKDGGKRQWYSSQNSNSDYLRYIENGAHDGPAYDYLDYAGNKIKSEGVFGPNGFLKPKNETAIRQRLRSTDSVIWDGVISTEEKFGKEHLSDSASAMELIKSEFPRFLKDCGFDPDNVIWFAGLHTNTDNRHIHVSWFEKEPRKVISNKKGLQWHRPLVPDIAIKDFKTRAELSLSGEKFGFLRARGDLMKRIAPIGETAKYEAGLQSLLSAVVERMPRGEFGYESHRCDGIRDDVDCISTFMLSKDDASASIYKAKIREAEQYDQSVLDVCRRNGDDPSKYLIEQKFIADIYRRSGNIVLKYLRDVKNAMPRYVASRSNEDFERARTKAEKKMTISVMARLDSAVNDDRNEAFEEFEDDMQRRRRKREKEEAEAERS